MSENISAVVEYSEIQPSSGNESISAVVEAPAKKPTQITLEIRQL